MSRARAPSRNQLAQFLPNPETIRAFELLFQDQAETSTDLTAIRVLIQEASVDAGVADNKAGQALDALNRIADAMELVAYAPAQQQVRGFAIKKFAADGDIGIGDFADVDASAGDVSITLPSPSGVPGQVCGIGKNDSSGNSVIAVGNINGDTSATITIQHTTLWLISVGSEWRAW